MADAAAPAAAAAATTDDDAATGGGRQPLSASPRPPPPLQLGPLPCELTTAILARLSPVERVLAEGTCKGWLAALRAPSLWARLDGVTLMDDLESYGYDGDFGADMFKHASTSVRAMHDPTGALYYDAILSLAEHCVLLEELHLSFDTDDGELRHVADAVKLIAARLPHLRDVNLGTINVCMYSRPEDMREMLESPLPHCAAKLALCDIFNPEADDPDFGATRLRQLAEALCRCGWKRVDLEINCDKHAQRVEVAAVLRDFLERLQAAPVVHRVCIVDPLGAEEAVWVARALPAQIRIDAWEIECTPADVAHLRDVFHPGAVKGGTLTLSGPPWPARAVVRAFDALRICAEGPPGDDNEERIMFSLRLDPPSQAQAPVLWSAGTCAPIAAGLLSGPGIIKSLHLAVDASGFLALLPALPSCLEELVLSRCSIEPDAHAALFQRVRDGQLPSLLTLQLAPFSSGAAALRISSELLALARPALQVKYNLTPTVSLNDEMACHLAMVRLLPGASLAHQGGEKTPAQSLLNLLQKWPAVHAWQRQLYDLGALPVIMAALQAAAAADDALSSHGHFSNVTALARLLCAVYELHDVSGRGDDDHEVAPPVSKDYAVLVTHSDEAAQCLAALLKRDTNSGCIALLLHNMLRYASHSASTARLVAAGCIAGLRSMTYSYHHAAYQREYLLSSFFLACRGTDLTYGADQLVAWLAKNSALVGVMLADLLQRITPAKRIIAEPGSLSTKDGYANRGVPPMQLSVYDMADFMHAVCAVAPAALTVEEKNVSSGVRAALLSLLDDARDAGSLLRSADTFAHCRDILLSAARASGGALCFSEQLDAAGVLAQLLQDADAACAAGRTLRLAAHEHPVALVSTRSSWPCMRPLNEHHGVIAHACDVCGREGTCILRCTTGCDFDCCAACAALLPFERRAVLAESEEAMPDAEAS
jgi:hypothetical protein